MQIEITEEERKFLERICRRAEKFLEMNIPMEFIKSSDINEIQQLIVKFRELDPTLLSLPAEGKMKCLYCDKEIERKATRQKYCSVCSGNVARMREKKNREKLNG